MLKSGDRIGEFELVAEIGRGAMGAVWEARQPSLSRTVAIKFLKATEPDETWIARFEAEAAQAARLSHPGILPVYAFGRHEDTPWFAMELVRGKDLDDLLTAQGPLQPQEAAAIIRDAARALHHAHEHGIVHRDVKPANILVRDDGRVAVTDFGLSKELGSNALTTTGLLVGTPYYLSPEAIAGDRSQVGPQADVYALGVTLYELLVGRPPFQAESALALIHQIGSEEPPALRSILPNAPKALDTLIGAAMAKDPGDRPAGADTLADELDRFLAGEAIETQPRTVRERVAQSVERHRLPLGIGLAAVLLVLGLAAWFLSQLDDKQDEIADTREALAAKEAALADLEGALEQAGEVREGLRGDAEAKRGARMTFADVVHLMTRKVLGKGPKATIPAAVRERWTGEAPVRLQVATTPPDATVEVLQLPDGGAWTRFEEREGEAGFYRFVARAPDHHTTIWSALVPPGTRATFEITLPRLADASKDMIHYAGFWGTPPGEPEATALQRAEGLRPYLLDATAVTAAAYSAWFMELPAAEQLRMKPEGRPTRVGRARRGGRRPLSGLESAMRALGPTQVAGYAKAHGKRLPSEAELANAFLTAALGKWLAKDAGEAADEVLGRLVGPEGIEPSGRPAEWVRDGGGPARPAALMQGRGARPRNLAADAALRLARDAP